MSLTTVHPGVNMPCPGCAVGHTTPSSRVHTGDLAVSAHGSPLSHRAARYHHTLRPCSSPPTPGPSHLS
ncbi:hypothetical protein E2C01_102502 [Portunus trituberculatus]|uniref:Uncharacterized protein n=1 Tax=Portunus trituberculatus TaxID=210409 RepID=A0A5B7KMR9_PORTR|nr:hypothetical protein [Portunus trituberculatus]